MSEDEPMITLGENDRVLSMLIKFAFADIDQAMLFLKLVPELLNKGLIKTFDQMKLNYFEKPGGEVMVRKIAGKQLFLQDCLDKGLEAAYAEWKKEPMKYYMKVFSKEQREEILGLMETNTLDSIMELEKKYPDIWEIALETFKKMRGGEEDLEEDDDIKEEDKKDEKGSLQELIDELNNPETDLNPHRYIYLLRTIRDAITFETQPRMWAMLHERLGTILLKYQAGNPSANIEEAINALEQTKRYAELQEDNFLMGATLSNLGSAYFTRLAGNPTENNKTAISYLEQSAGLLSQDEQPREWSACIVNLASCYAHSNVGGNTENIEKAISLLNPVVAKLSVDEYPAEWAKAHIALGNLFIQRQKGNRKKNIETAIMQLEMAEQVITEEDYPIEWSGLQNNLGMAYGYRETGSRAENIERAIAASKKSLSVLDKEENALDWAETMMNLGTYYQERTLGLQNENYAMAIKYFEKSLDVYSEEETPEKWGNVVYNLGILFQQIGEYDKAINYLLQSLGVSTREQRPVEWAEVMHEMGMAFSGQGDSAFEASMSCYDAALEVRTKETFPYDFAITSISAASTCRKFRETNPAELIEKEKQYLFNALEIFSIDTFPGYYAKVKRMLGRLFFDLDDWQNAITHLNDTLTTADLLYRSASSPAARQDALREFSGIHAMTAYSFAKIGKTEEAILTFEKGKARYFSETLARNEASLKEAKKGDQKKYTELVAKIAALENKTRNIHTPNASFIATTDTLKQRFAELNDLIQKIRGYIPEFMPEGLDTVQMQTLSAQLNLPVIYLVVTDKGSCALIVSNNRRETIWISDFTKGMLNTILYGEKGKTGYIKSIMDENPALLKSILPDTLKNISLMLQPISQWMKEKLKDKAILITDGMLSLLPLISEDEAIIFSLIPSAYFLDACIKRSENFKTQNDEARMVCIQDPLTSLAPLEFSSFETVFLQKLFKPGLTSILKGSEPVLKKVIKKIHGATYIHFSCHGVFSSTNPLNSALVLANDENLTLANILDGKLGFDEVKLCVLSACQTSLSDFNITPDEVVGFPVGLLQSGCMGVLGSIWSVNDLSTALLIGKFYEFYLTDNSQNNSVRALTKAQQWLKNVTNGNLTDLFMEYSSHTDAEIAKLAKAQFEKFARNDPNETPFAHPYYWAAFNFYGI